MKKQHKDFFPSQFMVWTFPTLNLEILSVHQGTVFFLFFILMENRKPDNLDVLCMPLSFSIKYKACKPAI